MRVDEILEKLDRNGYAPCLINDDEGGWAVSCEVVQEFFLYKDEAPEEPEFLVFVKPNRFCPTIKEAVEVFLKEEEIDIDSLPDNGDENETR